MGKRLGITAVAAIAAMVVWGAAPSGADTFRVTASGSEGEGWSWRPLTSHINEGDKVVWRNPTDKAHTVTAYGRGWSKDVTVQPGERTSKTFRKAGTFKFRCTVTGHSSLNDGRCVGMCGKVRAH